jgi:hypothetical protein
VLFCHITTQIQGEKNGRLLGEKGGNAFPYLAFLDADGRVCAKHPSGVARTVDGFSATAQKARDFLALKKKAETDKAAAVDFFFQAAEISHFTAAEARERSKTLAELTDDQKKRVEQILLALDVQEIAGGVNWQDKKTMADAGAKFLEMKKAGRIPTGDREMQSFWICIMEHAYAQKNAALFEEGFSALKEKFGSRMNKKFLEEREKQLAELKAEKK